MNKLLPCRYNTDSNRVEARFEDGTTLAIDCIAVEDEYGNTPAQPCQQHHGAHRTASPNLFLLSLPHHASLLLLCRSPVFFLHYITSAL